MTDTHEQATVVKLTVPGMGSDHCSGIVRSSLERLDGIADIHTNISNHRVTVTLEQGGPDADRLRQTVE